jgi:signal peptidase II
MRPSAKSIRVFWTAAVAVITLDVVTKLLAVQYLRPQHVPHRIIGDVVRFTLAYNPGAAFSMSLGNYSRLIFGGFALIALVILWWLYRTGKPDDSVRAFALGLTWGGAAGNLIDRFRSDLGVVDFIDIGVGDVRFWTFNAADSAVTVGAILLALVLWREDREAHRAARAGAPDAGGREARESAGGARP